MLAPFAWFDGGLICLVFGFVFTTAINRCGWGNWHKVRACILACPRFTFDYYLRSLPESALGKHCEQLLKSSEKYLLVSCDGVTQRIFLFLLDGCPCSLCSSYHREGGRVCFFPALLSLTSVMLVCAAGPARPDEERSEEGDGGAGGSDA